MTEPDLVDLVTVYKPEKTAVPIGGSGEISAVLDFQPAAEAAGATGKPTGETT